MYEDARSSGGTLFGVCVCVWHTDDGLDLLTDYIVISRRQVNSQPVHILLVLFDILYTMSQKTIHSTSDHNFSKLD